MNQFSTILKFELKGFFKNKSYVITTVLFVVIIAGIMFFPRIRAAFGGGGSVEITYGEPVYEMVLDATPEMVGQMNEVMMLGAYDEESAYAAAQPFAELFPEYLVMMTLESEEYIRSLVEEGHVACGIFIDSQTSYKYYVQNMEMTDNNADDADLAMRKVAQLSVMEELGIAQKDAEAILGTEITHQEISLGKNQAVNFFYTYIMIFVLYMAILLYGQMVAMNVATEKSSRAMELLITSAKPVSMMFGKVIASCIAGLVQILLIFGGIFLFYNLNKPYWGGSAAGTIIGMFFNIPAGLLVYMLIFFLLGFLFFGMMFGAIGSTVSKVEDVSTAITPAMILYLPGFFISIFSMTGGGVDSSLVRVFSFLPFSSPFVMFTRIAMSTVPGLEIALSVVILAVSVVLVGLLAARIYRVGVLLYGKRPNIFTMIKSVIRA
ncbi:MAG: ABC transporter permease [Lachnospiraceae bacterium]|nr:ABC transporter permease [Lachnospiraceae bacterium]